MQERAEPQASQPSVTPATPTTIPSMTKIATALQTLARTESAGERWPPPLRAPPEKKSLTRT
jgi:hypothetical protein